MKAAQQQHVESSVNESVSSKTPQLRKRFLAADLGIMAHTYSCPKLRSSLRKFIFRYMGISVGKSASLAYVAPGTALDTKDVIDACQ